MVGPKSKRNKYISYLLRISVAVAALYLTFRGEDLSRIANTLLQLNPWIFAASLMMWLLSQLIFVARWLLLLRVQSVNIGYWVAFRLHLLGVFYNNCLPTSVGGDLLRAWYVTTHTDKKVEAALSVFVDRVIGLTGLIIMAFCCYWFIPAGQEGQELSFGLDLRFLQRLTEHGSTIGVLGAGVVIVLLAFISTGRGRNLVKGWSGALRKRAVLVMQKIHKAMGIYWRKKPALALAMLLSFCCQAALIVGMWLAGREIGIDVHIKYYFVFFPVAWLLGALPISIGALGIWEGSLKLMFGKVAIGIDEPLSALALCHRIIWLLGSLPGVVIHLAGAHLPKEFFIDYEKSMA